MMMSGDKAPFRERFHIPRAPGGGECAYLSGHSLGLQPRSVRKYIEQELHDWERLGVEGHFHARDPWVSYHRLLTEQTAAIAGARPLEVVVMNSLTVNLHLMMVSFYRPSPERYKILMEGGAFPSDRFAVRSQIEFHGLDPAHALIELCPRPGEACLRESDILERLDQEGGSVALVMLGGVNYATGQALDLGAIARAGHAKGCRVGFDLAHAIGNLPLRLHESEADFAVWCSYKYLNAGPGAIAGCFVHERFAQQRNLPRFAGWWGHDQDTRFNMGPDFRTIPGAEGWQLSNPSILALASLRASMEIFEEAGIENLRARSMRLTGYLEALLLREQSEGFEILTPTNPEARGAQLSLKLKRKRRSVCEELAARGVLCDWREPDILRVAPAPLYNDAGDVERFVEVFLRTLT